MFSEAFIYGYHETLEKMAAPVHTNMPGSAPGRPITMGRDMPRQSINPWGAPEQQIASNQGFNPPVKAAPQQQNIPQQVMAPQRAAAPQHAHPKNLNAPGMEKEKAKYTQKQIDTWNDQYFRNHPNAKRPAASPAKAAPAAPSTGGAQSSQAFYTPGAATPRKAPEQQQFAQSNPNVSRNAYTPSYSPPGQIASQVAKAGVPTDVATGRSMMPGAKAVAPAQTAKTNPRALDPFSNVTQGSNLPRMFG